ncbi:MAG: substrate-binding domain-containing protein [Acetobacteraceae bacterium]|nr:substrate-binding domain-containing protein [Acetobacteraceae bacterium]
MSRKMSRLVLWALVLLLAAGLVGLGCAPKPAAKPAEPTPKTHFVVGWSTDNIEDPWKNHQTQCVIRAWSLHPEVTVLTAAAQGKVPVQISQVEDFIAKKVDLIQISVKDEKSLAPTLARAIEAGIPVVLTDRMVEGDKWTAAVKGDNVWIGQQAAKMMIEQIGGKGNVVIIEGLPGTTTAIERLEGFHSEIAKYPDIKVLGSQPGNYNQADSMRVMENFLTAFDRIDGVYAPSANMAYGAVRAIADAGRKAEVKSIISVDGEMNEIKEIINGNITGTVSYSNAAAVATEVAWRILKGEKYPEVIQYRGVVITPANAKDYYKEGAFTLDDVVFAPGSFTLEDVMAKSAVFTKAEYLAQKAKK